VDKVLILSGDQLYHMDFSDMLACHENADADVTIAGVPVYSHQAAGLGIMRLDDSGRVIGFLEKPQTEQELATSAPARAGSTPTAFPAAASDCLANMGIYLFNRDTLLDVLKKTDYRDFGKEVFPASIRARRVHVHLFDGYWEDIGTIKSFFEANLALAGIDAAFKLSSPSAPIYTRARFLPHPHGRRHRPRQPGGRRLHDRRGVGDRQQRGRAALPHRPRVVIRNSILLGNDFYEAPSGRPRGLLPWASGRHAIEGAIIDKNCRIGQNCGSPIPTAWTAPTRGVRHDLRRRGRDPQGTTIPDHWTINGGPAG